MGYLFTSESVSEGHPDKVADQISDAVLDKLLAYDPSSKVACETLVTTGQVVLAGEVKTKAYIDLQRVAREVINKIGYTKSEYMFEGNSCGVFSAIHEQSPDINRGVEREDPMNQGAGDQGMMFGYATNETENYMPLSLDLAHKLLMVLADIRREGKVMTYLRPDSKSQVTIEYDDNRRPVRIDTIVVSTQHIALVGYTNVGKSTLMNLLSKSEVFAENKLFATLHTTVRKVIIENLPFLLTDTVGFIRKLPTDLVDSFKSTLDEVREADLLIHVVDISHPDFEEQISVVDKTIADLEAGGKPTMIVFNKVDAYTYVEKAEDDLTPKTRENITLEELMKTWMAKLNDNCIFISAREKINMDELKTIIYNKVRELHVQKYPYNDFLYQTYDEE